MSAAHVATEGVLILPHLRVQNANAISSPLTHGFPAMTAFTGWAWALERKLMAQGIGLSIAATGVICHSHQELVTPGFVNTFRLTRNPVDKDGSTAAIVEEGRMHLDITLICAVVWDPGDRAGNVFSQGKAACQALAARIGELVASARIAGGSVLPAVPAPGRRVRPELLDIPEDAQARAEQFRRLRRHWLPGHALVGRDDLLEQRWQALRAKNAAATRLDALLDLSRFNWRAEAPLPDEESPRDSVVRWQHDRPAGSGWIVPIPVGYGALSQLHEAGSVRNARDSKTPFRFVESLYSMAEWVGPHRLTDIDDLLWYADHQADSGLYRVRNNYAKHLRQIG